MSLEELKISIVVPVYRVEAYLDRCISSLVSQTYRNLEILLVDDGSPDRCPAMCDAWAERDSRIRVIHKKNGGLSDARNAGMAEATGELMGFVDSDDAVTPDMYQLLFRHMAEDRADISACGVEMVWENGEPSRMLTPAGHRVLSRDEAMKAIINEDWLKQPVWYKLYKTELIRDLPFPVGKCHEDVFWSYLALGRAASVTVFDTPCYRYLQRAGSIMGVGYSLKRLDAIEAKVCRHRYLCSHFEALSALSTRNVWFSCLYQGQLAQTYLSSAEQKKVFAFCRHALVTCPLSGGMKKNCTPKERLWLMLASASLSGTCRIRNLLKIGL